MLKMFYNQTHKTLTDDFHLIIDSLPH